ncbi:hypothetical protein PgNI_05185 [Pyricularia grisea]|uniref:Uncharacterized protein n=1 Tax=Pyricularia grisea TaxID=148305 RepID=A0A6P8B5N4_PYRGI|nr:hypothetical protein PgNI_05185 [Pyricularia grisea]TLD10439.1 hypothetical protein PgNI_05185 [Pyricularia grisea]
MHVHKSTAWAVQSPAGPCFVAFGRVEHSTRGGCHSFVAPSHASASAIAAAPDVSVPVDAPGSFNDGGFLALVTACLLVRHFFPQRHARLRFAFPRARACAVGGLQGFVRTIRNPHFGRHGNKRQGWIALHPRIPHAALNRAPLRQVDSLLNLSTSRAAKIAGARLASVLP